jgi:hypothetical protein
LRSFREEIQYLGFYKDKAIQQEVPLIRHRRKNVTFSGDETTRLRGSGDGIDVEIGELMNRNLDAAQQTEGHPYQVFLLSAPESEETLRLRQEIRHTRRGGWTQGQRYTSSQALKRDPATTEELAAEGG